MTAAEQYVDRVVQRIPADLPLRQQVAMELGGLIAERLERGQPIEQILRQLGDPDVLAESYLSAVPLVSATFWSRVAAKIVDWVLVILTPLVVVALPLLVVARATSNTDRGAVFGGIAIGVCLLVLVFVGPAYFAIAEHVWGRTIGKRLFNLRVVQESGGRISLGQSVVRQLPSFLQVWIIDVLFALFTDKSQRAFEMLSKTRCVRST